MKVNLHPKEGLLFNAFMLVFIIHSIQAGVGMAGLPRIVYLEAKHDAWISVFLAGLTTSIILWFITKMLGQYENTDLYGIHMDVFGKWLGSTLSILYMAYLSTSFFVIFMNYIEIVQVWIFPTLPTWPLALVLILLSIYTVYGGIRVVVGLAFLSVVGTVWMVFVILIPVRYGDFTHLFPILNVSMKEIIAGIHSTSLSLMGFEVLMFVYPFIKNKQKVMLYAQIGNFVTTLVFTLLTFISIVFFASASLERTIWPVISMFKVVRLPNLERFEFIAVSFWMLIILPNMCLYLWSASRGFSRIMNRRQKMGIWVLSLLTFTTSFFVKTRYQMNTITDMVAQTGFYIAFCYPVFLSIIVFIKKGLARRKNADAS
jgi:spore germination protein (amino acid permease)